MDELSGSPRPTLPTFTSTMTEQERGEARLGQQPRKWGGVQAIMARVPRVPACNPKHEFFAISDTFLCRKHAQQVFRCCMGNGDSFVSQPAVI